MVRKPLLDRRRVATRINYQRKPRCVVRNKIAVLLPLAILKRRHRVGHRTPPKYKIWPVMFLASFEAKKSMAATISEVSSNLGFMRRPFKAAIAASFRALAIPVLATCDKPMLL